MPFLHCIVNKCSIPASDKFPAFFSSALPRSSAALSHRSLSSLSLHKLTHTKRFFSDNSNASRGAIIAGIVLAVLGLVLAAWRFSRTQRHREDLSSQAKLNTDPTHWVPHSTSIAPPAYGYKMAGGKPVGVGPYPAPAEIHQKTRQKPHWNDVNQLNRTDGSRAGRPRGSGQLYELPQRHDERNHSQNRLMGSGV